MDLAQPLFPPPEGYRWVLYEDVEVFDGTGAAAGLNLPPTWNADGTLYISNFEGRTTYTNGSNFGVAGAAAYELGRTIYYQVKVYADGAPYGLMAIEFGPDGVSEAAGSTYINVNGGDAFRSYASPPAVWPEQMTVTYQAHTHDSVAGSLGVEVMKWVGDVWVALPIQDVVPGSPTSPVGTGGECPPVCAPNNGGGPGGEGGGTTPTERAALTTAPELTWPRTQGRVDVTMLDLGALAGLTYADEWDGEQLFLLDGYRLEVAALPAGGFTQRCEYRFTKLPGTNAVNERYYFTTNVHQTNDLVHHTRH